MKTRRMFLIALCGVVMLIGASSCKKEKQENENGETMTIKASLGSADNNSKTHLVGRTVKWDTGDAFKLFRTASTEGTKFTLTRTGEDGDVGYFEGKHPGDAPYYACYPFNNVSCTAARTFTFSIPQVQNDSPETVSGNSNAGPMVGFMEDPSGTLEFQNVMSWLKVGLKGNVVIKRITLTDLSGVDGLTETTELTEEMINNANNKKLNGTFTVTCSGDTESNFDFETAMSGGTNQLEIVSDNGTQLSDEYTYFWFQVPAGSLKNLELDAYVDVDGLAKVLKLTKTISGGVVGNTVLTAEVNSSITITGAEVTTEVGCSDEFISQLKVKVKGKDPNLTTYMVGVCYNYADSEDPTIGHCIGYKEIGTFTIANGSTQDINYDFDRLDLEDNKRYKICAYATNGIYAYSTECVEIDAGDGPQDMTWTGGKSPYAFTVASGKQVYFSQGNLQYVKSTNTWQFAEHQYDIVETLNQDVGENYATQNIVTLFGWGTSGYNNKYPYMTSMTNSDYGNGDRNISGTNYDWGVYNAISNGTGSSWRTLTDGSGGEWDYLITKRTNAANLYGLGKVGNCTPGLIILPDDWKWEGDVAEFGPSATEVSRRWKSGVSSWSNVYSYSEWAKMEAAGAVFLPAAGARNGTSFVNVGSGGYYWSSSYSDSNRAYSLYFSSGDVSPNYYYYVRHNGFSVRLVSNKK